MFKCLYIFGRYFHKRVFSIYGSFHFHNNSSLSHTGISALPFRHNFVSYISMITTRSYVVVVQLRKSVWLALNFGRKSLDHRFCSKVFSLDIYIVKVSHYLKYYNKFDNNNTIIILFQISYSYFENVNTLQGRIDRGRIDRDRIDQGDRIDRDRID